MKILQINNYYDFGSTGKIVKDIHYYLKKKGVDSYVAYGRGSRQKDSLLYKFCYEVEAKLQGGYSILSGNSYGGSPYSTKRLISYIENIKPDVVHVHCINAFSVNIPKLLSYLADARIKTVVTHHAEFFYTGNCAYAINCTKWQVEKGCFDCERKSGRGVLGIDMLESNWRRMMAAVSKFDENNLISVVVSPWLKRRIELSPFWGKYSSIVVKNGINTKVFRYRENARDLLTNLDMTRHYNKICVHVTPRFTTSDSIKGGQFIFPIAKDMPDVLFIIVAVSTEQGISAPNNVLFWGKAKSQDELATLYGCADVTLLTSERETFSMICAESLCCGTPVVGFKAGGPETISIKEFSSFVEYADIAAIKSEMQRIISLQLDHKIVSERSIPVYDCNTMGKEMLDVYNMILQGR